MVQGPKSSTLKYDPIICEGCNSTRSQPYDQAYERFVQWLFQNEQEVLRRRFINFATIYGASFAEGQLNLYKYFAKSFGCRVAEAEKSVPIDVVELLSQSHFQTGLRLNFSVNEDVLAMPAADRDRFIGKGDLYAMVSRSDPTEITGYLWNEHVSWFTTNYWYCEEPDGDHGSTWVANAQHIYLGSFAPLPEEMR